MGGQAHPVSVALQALGDGQEGLDVAAGARHQDGDAQGRRRLAQHRRAGRALEAQLPVLTQPLLARRRVVPGRQVEVDADAVVVGERQLLSRALGELAQPGQLELVLEERGNPTRGARLRVACHNATA